VKKCVAVDFDGTLAKHYMDDGSPYEPLRVGEPVMRMVSRVRRWLAAGDEVVIFTARLHPKHDIGDIVDATRAVEAFCLEQFGQKLPVTCMKDPDFVEMWDDRAVTVRVNEGYPCLHVETDVDTDAIGEFLM